MLISKIRKYSWFVAGLIALSLIIFLLQSALNSQSGLFNHNKTPDYASIDGHEIVADNINEDYQNVVTQYAAQNQELDKLINGDIQLDPRTRFQIGEQAWNQYLTDYMVDEQLNKLGITISDQELQDIIYGPDPSPYIKNTYSQGGKFDAQAFINYVNQIKDPQTQQNNPQAVQAFVYFNMLQRLAILDYKKTKYLSLFSKAAYVPEWMVTRDYEIKNRRASFSFVDLQYASIPDSSVQVNDQDLKKYYEEHKNAYKKEESRVIDYVSWQFTPTYTDSAGTLNRLVANTEKMKTAKSDSSYIVSHSEDPARFDNTYYERSELYPKGIDSSKVDSFFTKPVGSFIGPYYEGGYYKVAKIWDRKTMADSAKVRHILVKTENRTDAAAKSLADSLLTVLNAGANFDSIASKYSEDDATKDKGGDLGWITPKTNFVRPFMKYTFEDGKVNEIGEVKSQFGYHIIQITEMRKSKEYVKLAFLSTEITSSKETEDSIDRIAGEFYEKYQSPETFDQGVTEYHLAKKTTPPLQKNTYDIPGIDDSREIVTWSFNNEQGTFKYFSLQNQIVIAYLKEVDEKGIAPFENVKDQVKQEVIREKKGEMLKKKLDDAVAGGATTLDAIAAKVGSTVKTSDQASFATPYAVGLGLEPKVIGTVFGDGQGKMTAGIAGQRAAYIALATTVTEPDANGDKTLNRNQLQYSAAGKYNEQNVMKALKDKTDIVDNRYMFGND